MVNCRIFSLPVIKLCLTLLTEKYGERQIGFKKFNSHINTNILRGQINASNIFVNIPHPK